MAKSTGKCHFLTLVYVSAVEITLVLSRALVCKSENAFACVLLCNVTDKKNPYQVSAKVPNTPADL